MKYFKAFELVPPDVYEIRREKSLQLFDPNLLKLADWLRARYGPATINNWYWGGAFSQSGLRTMEHYGTWKAFEKSFSQHKYGRALDMKFKDKTAEEVRTDLKALWELEGLGFAITLENNVSWLHVDTRPQDRLLTSFNP